MCTSKRLRDCGNKDPAFPAHLAAKRTAFLQTLFWTRVRFLSRAWGSIQRAVLLGLPVRADQVHVLQKDEQSMEITARFMSRKRNKSHIALYLSLRAPGATPPTGVLGHMDIDLPSVYATPAHKRTQRQHDEMCVWMRDRSPDVDDKFAELNQHFVDAGRPIFAYW